MQAAIVAVGTELLATQKQETNSLYLASQLESLGIAVAEKHVIGDDRPRLARTLQQALEQNPLVIATGGLGPTEDDITREAAAEALGRALVLDESLLSRLQERFTRHGRIMAPNNRRQAMVIEGACVLPNPNGTAPGQWVEHNGRILILLPGPPREMRPIFEAECLPRLRARVPQQVIRMAFLRVAGLGESDLDHLIAPIYKQYTNPSTTVLFSSGDIQIQLRAVAATEAGAQALLDELIERLAAVLGRRLYSRTGEPMEAVVGQMLRDRRATLAVAESCTGGELAARITSVPGSSAHFIGGFITYSNHAKIQLLGVDGPTLESQGAVSEPVARQMAIGARTRLGAVYGLSVTGFAGPEGGTDRDPVGTVYIGCATPDHTLVRRFRFFGGRDRVRALSSFYALDFLRLEMLSEPPATPEASCVSLHPQVIRP
jgi:nicotinamide-nucleotide amidase